MGVVYLKFSLLADIQSRWDCRAERAGQIDALDDRSIRDWT
jgi:hypothetical protein